MDNDNTPTMSQDGDTVTADGHTFRLRLEPDHDTVVNDFDCYGTVLPMRRSVFTGTDQPEGMTERTRQLTAIDGPFYWEPPEGFGSWPSVAQRALEYEVQDLVSFGFQIVVVERTQGEDFYGRPVVVDAATLGAVERDAGAVADAASELLDELLHRASTTSV